MSIMTQGAGTIGRLARRVGRYAIVAGTIPGFAACASHGHRTSMGIAPEMVVGESVTGIALLGSLHVSDSVRSIADAALADAVREVCPSVTVIPAGETERQLEARGVVVPRRLSASFARETGRALNVDLLLAPTVTGLTYDTRNTVAGLIDAIGRPAQYMFDDRAGVALEGWDLRLATLAVRVVRTHASENSWTADPVRLLRNATRDAVGRMAPLCRPTVSARQAR